FGGLSSQNDKALKDSLKWNEKNDRYNSQFVSNTGATGVTHSIMIGSKTNLRSAVAFSYNKIAENYQYIEDDYSSSEAYRDNYKTHKWTISSTLNHKFSVKNSLRAGAIVNFIGFDYYKKSKENDDAPLKEVIDTKNNTQTVQAFAQWQFRPANALTFNAGLHYLQLLYNNTSAIEPRASLKWQLNKSNSIALGYGGHSQVQAMGVYFAQLQGNDDKLFHPNKGLGLTKAHHYVASYQHAFNKNLSVKIETYYQQLYNVPISISDTSTLSLLNIENEYVTDALVNKGKGRNYGIEVSLEKYLANNFYYTISTSLYQSKYTAADGIERNTRFNGNHVNTLVAGKEFLSAGKLRTFGINIKTVYAGGLHTTPIDLDKSIEKGYGVYRDKEAFSLQNPAYFRTDLRLSMKWNRRHHTSTLSLDIQNVTNRLNVYGQRFDDEKNKVVTSYQNGLIPVLNYKVEF
ncbi:MAG: TonB-dependent receptor, partial [Chitinophagaceae bacterium]